MEKIKKITLNYRTMDYKKELIQLLGYCIENRNFLRNSEGQISVFVTDAVNKYKL